MLRRFFISFADVCFLNLLALNLTDVCKKLACSQTLYFLFKVRRARVIKNKPRGIDQQRREVVVGEEENFSFSRSALVLVRSLADVFEKNEKKKNWQRLCTG